MVGRKDAIGQRHVLNHVLVIGKWNGLERFQLVALSVNIVQSSAKSRHEIRVRRNFRRRIEAEIVRQILIGRGKGNIVQMAGATEIRYETNLMIVSVNSQT